MLTLPSILGDADIPFAMVPGNHDYDNYNWYSDNNGPGSNRPLKGATVWNQYFGANSHHFANKSWYRGGGAYGNDMNSFQIIDKDDFKFLHLALEMEPTTDDLLWAQRVLDGNPNLPVIITTHEWLVPSLDKNSPWANDYDAYFKGTSHLSPDKVWDRFVRKNKNIFMILSGHAWTPTVEGISNGENLRIDKNDDGYPVYQLLQDYQGNTIGPDGKPGSANGGGGWLRFIEFDTEAKKIHFYTYSTLLNKYAGKNGERTFNIPAEYSDFELDFPPQLLN
ncbi:metallophosphoesterase [Orbus mooreae]|uniref:metallophosphoesterase n=1 Tax=Orbus mooreae TaxID=3074107 RepID=UPI00370DB9CB